MTDTVRLSPSGPFLVNVLQESYSVSAGGVGAPIVATPGLLVHYQATIPEDGLALVGWLAQLIGDAVLASVVTLVLKIDGVAILTQEVSVPAGAHVPVNFPADLCRASVLAGNVTWDLYGSAAGGGTVTFFTQNSHLQVLKQ